MRMITNGLAWLQSQLAEHASTAVTYVRGTDQIEVPDAVLGKSTFESQDVAGGITARSILLDWLISPSRLEIQGQSIEPAAGDEIWHVSGSTTRRYQVVPLGMEPCWRWSGPSRDRMRIHVQEIPG